MHIYIYIYPPGSDLSDCDCARIETKASIRRICDCDSALESIIELRLRLR